MVGRAPGEEEGVRRYRMWHKLVLVANDYGIENDLESRIYFVVGERQEAIGTHGRVCILHVF